MASVKSTVLVSMLMRLFWLSVVQAQLQNNAYSTTCEPDSTGIVMLDLENSRDVDVTFVIECWQDSYHITVPAGRQLAYPTMLYEEDGPRGNLCMFNTHVEGEVDKILVAVVESSQVFLFSFIFCDKRKQPPSRILPYTTSCNPDSFGFVDIIFFNPDDVAMLVYISCWYGNEEIWVPPSGNHTLSAEYYRGDYQAYRGCVFNPWTADDTQLLYFEKISEGEVYPFRAYCKKDLSMSRPNVAVSVTCPDDGSDRIQLHLENKEKDYMKLLVDCSNRWKTISLPKQGSVTVEASFEPSPLSSCPSDVCCLNRVESVFGKHEYLKILSQSKATGGHSWDVVFCGKTWRTGPPSEKYRTDCVPDKSGFVPIRLENTGDERLTFTLVCQQNRIEAYVGPQSMTTFSAQYFSGDDRTDSCMFSPESEEGVQSVKLFVGKSLDMFHDVNIYCDKRQTPPVRILPYETDCSMIRDGQITVTLKNSRYTPVVYWVTCWFESIKVLVQPLSKTDLIVLPFQGEGRDYGNVCVLNPWVDSIQYLTIQTSGDGNIDQLEHVLYCKTMPADDSPKVTFHSDCLPDTRGAMRLLINNNDIEVLTVSMSCENGAKSFKVNPTSTTTISGYLFQENVTYADDSCVFTTWDEYFRGEHQFIWVLAEKRNGNFSSGLIVCDNTAYTFHMDGQYRSTCRRDQNGVVPLNLFNHGDETLTIRLVCWEEIYDVVVQPQSSIVYPAMFKKDALKSVHRDVCVLNEPSRHNAGISIFFEQPGDVFYRGDLYCDTSSKVTRPAIRYSTTCLTDRNGLVDIDIINDSDQMLWYTLMCWKDLDTFGLDGHETKSVKAKFYDGNLDKEICQFIPVFADGTQYLYLNSQTLDGPALNHVIYCKTSPSKDPPEILVTTDCIECTKSGVLSISVENDDSEVISWTHFCKGQQISGKLKPQSSVELSAALYRDDDYKYPDVDCIFWPFDTGYGNHTKQYSWLLATRADGNYTVKYVFCALNDVKDVTTETTENHSGPFEIEYSVETTGPMSEVNSHLPPKAQIHELYEAETGDKVRMEGGTSDQTDIDSRASTQTKSVTSAPMESVTSAPIEIVTSVPIESVTSAPAPIKSVTSAPIKSVTSAPIESVTSAPIESVTSALIESVTSAPIESVTSATIKSVTSAPIESLTSAPIESVTSSTIESVTSSTIESVTSSPIESVTSARTKTSRTPARLQSHPENSGTPSRTDISRTPSRTDISGTPSRTDISWTPSRTDISWTPSRTDSSGTPSRTDSSGTPSRTDSSGRPSRTDSSGRPSRTDISGTPSRTDSSGTPSRGEDSGTLTKDESSVHTHSETPANIDRYMDEAKSRLPSHDDVEPIATSVSFESDKPIVALIPHCPKQLSGHPVLELRSDVPAYGLAICQNGEHQFTPANSVSYRLEGSFDQTDVENRCQFFKKQGIPTFTVKVEVGWGEKNRELILYQKLFVVSCSYDEYGSATSNTEAIGDWFLAPSVDQYHLGEHYPVAFDLHILDALGRRILANHISIGKKIRLKAVDRTGNIPAFRALNCWATNEANSYPILRAGCGDGLIFKRFIGFETQGRFVYSPYFNAFKLHGGNTIRFDCTFTSCSTGSCDGDSCDTVKLVRRSINDREKRAIKDRVRLSTSSNKFQLT